MVTRLKRQRIVLFSAFVLISGVSATSMSLFKLKQAINVPGVKILATVAARPGIAIPSYDLSHLRELDLASLQNRGVKYVVFDKDNTLR
jgi:hypothetical protein